MIIRLVLSLLILFCAAPAFSATQNAASCSVADITTAIAAASAGDTVSVPAGDCSWTTTLTIDKGIILSGAGTGDSGTNITSGGANGYITFNANVNGWRVTGMSFETANANYAAIQYVGNGNSTGWRIDGCKFTGYHFAVALAGNFSSSTASSLIDNNEIYGGGLQFFALADTGNEIDGGKAWDNETQLGSANFVFIENNHFSDLNSLAQIMHVIAANKSTRIVARYNDVIAEATTGTYKGIADAIDFHGYGHGTNIRGVRAYEAYNNKHTSPGGQANGSFVYARGGTGVIYSNQTLPDASYYRKPISVFETRAYPGGSSTLSSAVSTACENNTGGVAICNANFTRLQVASNPYGSFTPGDVVTGATSGASGTVTLVTNSGGYYIYFLTVTGGPFANGENLQVGGVTIMASAAASEAQTGEGHPCCDQVGRGKDQASDPLYAWGNIDQNGTKASIGPDTDQAAFLADGVDYVDSAEAKAGYSAYTCPYPLTAAGLPNPGGETTGSCGAGAGQSFYTRTGDTLRTVTATATNATVSPTSIGTTGAAVEITVTNSYGYTASCSGCGGTLSGSTFTTAAITGDCTVTCTGLGRRGVLGGSGTVTLGGSGTATLGN